MKTALGNGLNPIFVGSGRSVFHVAHRPTPSNGYTSSSSLRPQLLTHMRFFMTTLPVIVGRFGIGREQTRSETELT